MIQNIGRAARNPDSEVVLYAEKFTDSMVKSLRETYRRRHIQQSYNTEHGKTPEQAVSNVKDLDVVRTDEDLRLNQDFNLSKKGKVKRLKRMTKKEQALIAADLRDQLQVAIQEWRFEDAATLRDQLKELTGE
ncbi:MAG: hypothetical protein H6765_11170 [Candidatus Peribacteria bacterium]|nr:MAG: hypothetical protein H6765_11170 [Candidatus Peribacteria bacterium]